MSYEIDNNERRTPLGEIKKFVRTLSQIRMVHRRQREGLLCIYTGSRIFFLRNSFDRLANQEFLSSFF